VWARENGWQDMTCHYYRFVGTAEECRTAEIAALEYRAANGLDFSVHLF
jgi:hypothetical protein